MRTTNKELLMAKAIFVLTEFHKPTKMLDAISYGLIGFDGNVMFNKAFQDADHLKGYLQMVARTKKERNS